MGSEFVGSWQARGPSGFTRLVEDCYGAKHRTIPPAAHTYQSDVESFHGLIERELFRVEGFRSQEDFLVKATTYQVFFNYGRGNSYKGGKTPIEIIRERDPTIDPRIGLLPPVYLGSLLRERARPLPTPAQKGYNACSQVCIDAPNPNYHHCTVFAGWYAN